ncbi:hypothetical protein OsccyDRAFT_0589 [Leptolyngbyaceae cyanobacterium JSC-12]|nr:hypothetical protein OsccyDRAFT_0589 [Leptolyngbyaceae cyanobacterium JSC-12]
MAKLPINWDVWDPYEKACMYGAIRFVHEKFCIVSDFPIKLTVDNQNRPHNSEGPFCEWADGSKLYSWHGVRVPAWTIEHKNLITKEKILAETNVEIRRSMCEIIGWDKTLELFDPVVIDSDTSLELPRRLLSIKLNNEEVRLLEVFNGTVENGSRRRFLLGVPTEINTCSAGVAWSYGLSTDSYKEGVRT